MTNSNLTYTTSKHIAYSGFINRGKVKYKVNANKDGNKSKSGICNEILHSGLNQLDIALEVYHRVLLIRFDLHTNLSTIDNKIIAYFFDKLKRNLIRKHKFKDIGYWWVREIEKSQTQHYHCALFLDMAKVQDSYTVLKIARKTWMKTQGNTMPDIPYPYHQINNKNPLDNEDALKYPNLKCHHDTKAGAIWRISYLAKPRSKRRENKQTKNYGTSKLQKRHANIYKKIKQELKK